MNKLKTAYWFGKTLFFGTWVTQIFIIAFLRGEQQLFGAATMLSLAIVGFFSWMVARDRLTSGEEYD